MCDYTGYILGFVSSYVFYNHQLHRQTPCRHLQTPSRHQQTPPRHPSDIIQTPFRHSTNAFYGHFGFYQSISLNPPYNTSGTPETPIDTHRHPRHPLYSLQTTSRHPPDALYSHRWCPNKIVQCTLHMPQTWYIALELFNYQCVRRRSPQICTVCNSVTFVKILIRMNVRIYSYQQSYTNEYPNIFILFF